MYGNSGYLGGCVKPPPPTPSHRPALRRPRSSKCRARELGHPAKSPRDWWTTSSNDMDNHSTLSARSFQNFPSAQKPGTMSSTAYSNQALALWNEQRCAWVGTQPRPPPPREPREPAIRFSIFIVCLTLFFVVNFASGFIPKHYSDLDLPCAAGILHMRNYLQQVDHSRSLSLYRKWWTFLLMYGSKRECTNEDN